MPVVVWATRSVDVGNAIAVTVAVRAAALNVLSVMASTIVITPMVTGRGCVNLPGLHIHRRCLHINARYLHADRKGHIAAGVRRRSRRENAQRERDGCE